MKRNDKTRKVAEEILAAFEAGRIPKALAQVFIHRKDECPASHWSWRNRLLLALRGHIDARGYRQWKEVGRQVMKGQKACHILVPRLRAAKREDEPETELETNTGAGGPRLLGFTAVAVFGRDQTEGDALPGDEEEIAFLDALPLIEVARDWDLAVSTFSGEGSPRLGYYRHGEAIGLGVENLATWTHELVHAADDRLGTLNARPGQQLDNEVVAELGGAVLLECLGYPNESDRGGAWRYIQLYCDRHDRSAMAVASELLDRTCACVSLILESGGDSQEA